jgi:hypothetical protein
MRIVTGPVVGRRVQHRRGQPGNDRKMLLCEPRGHVVVVRRNPLRHPQRSGDGTVDRKDIVVRDRLVGVERVPQLHLLRGRQPPRGVDLGGVLFSGADLPVTGGQIAEFGCQCVDRRADREVVGGVGELDAARRHRWVAGRVAVVADRGAQRDGAARELVPQRRPAACLRQDLVAVVHWATPGVEDELVVTVANHQHGAVTGVILGSQIVKVRGGDGGELVAGNVVEDIDVNLEKRRSPRHVVAEGVIDGGRSRHHAELLGQVGNLCAAIWRRRGAGRYHERRRDEQKAKQAPPADAHQPILPTLLRPTNPGTFPVTPRLLPGSHAQIAL